MIADSRLAKLHNAPPYTQYDFALSVAYIK